MDKLPKEHLTHRDPELREMEIGDIRWIASARVDDDGAMWVQKSTETKTECHPGPVGPRYQVKVERLNDGWKVSIPKSYLPLDPYRVGLVDSVCFLVTEIEITDD